MTHSFKLFRAALLLVLLFGIVGTGVELLLLAHTEDLWQWEPLVMLAVGLPVLLWHAAVGSIRSRRLSGAVMVLYVASGMVGTFLHYRGNVEFELEMVPALGGLSLFREAMTGATPVLAPGTLIQLGLIGLLYVLITGEQDITWKDFTTN